MNVDQNRKPLKRRGTEEAEEIRDRKQEPTTDEEL
jgi:hypothetical protein